LIPWSKAKSIGTNVTVDPDEAKMPDLALPALIGFLIENPHVEA
jgi:hypothetical protein